MYTSKVLHTLSLVSLLSLPVAAQARTINMFETEDGYQSVPANASETAVEANPYADLATMTIADILKMDGNGSPVTVQVHVPSEEGEGGTDSLVVFSPEFPEGVVRPDTEHPPVAQTPLPAAAWLMMSGMAGMTMVARRRHQGVAAAKSA